MYYKMYYYKFQKCINNILKTFYSMTIIDKSQEDRSFNILYIHITLNVHSLFSSFIGTRKVILCINIHYIYL